jgi:hypothetical protein
MFNNRTACDGDVTALSILSFDTCPQSAHCADSEVNSVVQFAEQRYGDHA